MAVPVHVWDVQHSRQQSKIKLERGGLRDRAKQASRCQQVGQENVLDWLCRLWCLRKVSVCAALRWASTRRWESRSHCQTIQWSVRFKSDEHEESQRGWCLDSFWIQARPQRPRWHQISWRRWVFARNSQQKRSNGRLLFRKMACWRRIRLAPSRLCSLECLGRIRDGWFLHEGLLLPFWVSLDHRARVQDPKVDRILYDGADSTLANSVFAKKVADDSWAQENYWWGFQRPHCHDTCFVDEKMGLNPWKDCWYPRKYEELFQRQSAFVQS